MRLLLNDSFNNVRVVQVMYWLIAVLLAVFYAYAGGKKVLQTREQLEPMMGWVDTIPMPLVRTIGALEVLGALGLILPPLTGIAPGLAVAAALGFVVLQIGGIAVHLTRGEARLIGLNVALLALAAAAALLAPSTF